MPQLKTVEFNEKDQTRIRQILGGFPFSAALENRPSDVLHSEFSGDNLCLILNELSGIVHDYTEKHNEIEKNYNALKRDLETMRRMLGILK